MEAFEKKAEEGSDEAHGMLRLNKALKALLYCWS